METQKLLIKIAYCLIGLSILVLIGLSIFRHYLIKKQSEDSAIETVIKFDSPGESISGDSTTDQEDALKITGSAGK